MNESSWISQERCQEIQRTERTAAVQIKGWIFEISASPESPKKITGSRLAGDSESGCFQSSHPHCLHSLLLSNTKSLSLSLSASQGGLRPISVTTANHWWPVTTPSFGVMVWLLLRGWLAGCFALVIGGVNIVYPFLKHFFFIFWLYLNFVHVCSPCQHIFFI